MGWALNEKGFPDVVIAWKFLLRGINIRHGEMKFIQNLKKTN